MQFIINYYNDIIIFCPASPVSFLPQENLNPCNFHANLSIAGVYLLH